MINKNIVAACVVGIGLSSALIAQEPQTPTPQQEPQQPAVSREAPQQSSTVLTGCVYREEDVPGRAPNPAERAGVLEDYILVASASETAPPRGEPGATPGAVGTSGTGPAAMYKLEIASDEQLRAVVGKRVEVTGRIDAEAGDAPGRPAAPTSEADRAIGRDRVNLSEFEVVSIKEVPGSCPAKPSQR